MHSTNGQLITLEEHYRVKLNYLSDFYDNMLEFVQQQKRQHLSLLKQDISRNLELAQVRVQQNDDYLQEVNSIVQDIESQMEAIINVITEAQFRKCLNEYQRSLEECKQSIVAQHTFIQRTTDPEVEALQDKLVQFQAAIEQIIGRDESAGRKAAGSNFSFDGSSMNTRPAKSAFRNLFDSSQQGSEAEMQNHQSPQFKVI